MKYLLSSLILGLVIMVISSLGFSNCQLVEVDVFKTVSIIVLDGEIHPGMKNGTFSVPKGFIKSLNAAFVPTSARAINRPQAGTTKRNGRVLLAHPIFPARPDLVLKFHGRSSEIVIGLMMFEGGLIAWDLVMREGGRPFLCRDADQVHKIFADIARLDL